jgi:predicted dehydrogenase
MPQVALAGCAHIHTPGFVKRLQARRDVRVKSVWDHDRDRARRWAGELGAGVAPAPEAVWEDGEITAAIICSETVRHLELVTAGAAAGKHLFVEKPLGMRAADAYEMAGAIERAGVLFQTGYFMRGNPVNRFLKEEIARGTFGALTRARVSVTHAAALGGWFDSEWRWMADAEQAGFGGFGDLGTHALDLLLWVHGEPEVESATAIVNSATGRYGDLDEYGEGMLRFEGSTAGTLAAGWVDLANPVQMVVSGTKAHALVLDGKLYLKSEEIEGAGGEEPWTRLPEPLPHAFELFLDAVSGRRDVPLVTPREAAVRSAVMEALYEGAARQTWARPRKG